MFSIVIATPDVVGERMAGPGIRAWHFAHELAKHFPTTLVASLEGEVSETPFSIVARDSREAREAMRGAAVLIGQPARRFRRRRREQRIIYDLFDPTLLELNETYGRHPSLRQRIHLGAEWWRLRTALSEGDLLICATARQRDLYNGVGDRMIEIPFGVDNTPVAAGFSRSGPAEARPHTTPTILWGGGLWEWLDPRTAVDAVVQLNREGVACRLLFLGRYRPNPHVVDRRREDRFDQLLQSGRPYVEANDEWVAYRDRLSWLRRSKIAIMLHRPTAEAVYSIRTRLFDAIAAGVPVITTEEGFAADLVRGEGLGVVVPPLDPIAVAAAIRRLLQDDVFYRECVSNLARVRPRFAWDVVMRPLIEVIRQWQKQS